MLLLWNDIHTELSLIFLMPKSSYKQTAWPSVLYTKSIHDVINVSTINLSYLRTDKVLLAQHTELYSSAPEKYPMDVNKIILLRVLFGISEYATRRETAFLCGRNTNNFHNFSWSNYTLPKGSPCSLYMEDDTV